MKSRVPQKKDDHLPPIGIPVLVQCDGFRCMAFRDKDGKWRDYFYKDQLPEIIEWTELETFR
jgi:hypothetical protein